VKDVYIAMSIITAIANDGNLKTLIEGEYNLELGEICEQHLADYLTANGLPSYRACQRFVKSDRLKSRRKQWQYAIDEQEYSELSCQIKYDGIVHVEREMLKLDFMPHPTYKVLTGDPAMDCSLLRPHQRDILVKIDKVRRLSVEVKALTPRAFAFAQLQIGCCPKYDNKKFRIAAIVLINQETGEAWVASGEKSEMLRQRTKNGDNGFSYAVERSRLTPLDIWIEVTKDIYGL
jgi:hypothetical protein